MRENPDIKCDMNNKEYSDMAITGGFFLVLYATVPLAWFGYVLNKAKKEGRLGEMSMMRGYGPLYLHYTPRNPLWEVYGESPPSHASVSIDHDPPQIHTFTDLQVLFFRSLQCYSASCCWYWCSASSRDGPAGS
jgi:hypothetical protein